MTANLAKLYLILALPLIAVSAIHHVVYCQTHSWIDFWDLHLGNPVDHCMTAPHRMSRLDPTAGATLFIGPSSMTQAVDVDLLRASGHAAVVAEIGPDLVTGAEIYLDWFLERRPDKQHLDAVVLWMHPFCFQDESAPDRSVASGTVTARPLEKKLARWYVDPFKLVRRQSATTSKSRLLHGHIDHVFQANRYAHHFKRALTNYSGKSIIPHYQPEFPHARYMTDRLETRDFDEPLSREVWGTTYSGSRYTFPNMQTRSLDIIRATCQHHGISLSFVIPPERVWVRESSTTIVRQLHEHLDLDPSDWLNLHPALPEDHFYDAMHPNGPGRRIVSERLVGFLNER